MKYCILQLTSYFVLLLLWAGTDRGLAADQPIKIIRDINGFPPPIKISISGFPAEVENVLKFDLLFMGFTNVPPDQAQFIVNGTTNPGIGARVIERVNRNEVLAKAYTGGSQRTQIHALADDIAETITHQPGIAKTKVAFKVDTGATSEIYIADYDGHNPQPVTRDRNLVAAPCWGGASTLLYTSYKNGNPNIFSHDFATGARNAVTRFPGLNTSAAVSPNRRKVAMILSKGGSPDLYVSDFDGSNLKQLTMTRDDEASPCWSPDGAWICFSSRKTGVTALYKISATGGEMQRLPTPGAPSPTEPDWSPDGRFIIFTSMTRAGFDLCLVPANGRGEGSVMVLVAGEDPSWAPNSRAVVFARRQRGERVLSLLDVPTKQVKDIGRISGSNSQPSWAK
jgi:TolB protein